VYGTTARSFVAVAIGFLLGVCAISSEPQTTSKPASKPSSKSTAKPQPQSLAEQLLAENIADLAADSLRYGDPWRGALLFHQARLACTRCHPTGDEKNLLGPDLARFDVQVTPEYLIESMLEPSKVIRKDYQTAIVIDNSGGSFTGIFVAETANSIVLREADRGGELTTIDLDIVEAWSLSPQSIMPEGIANLMAGRHEFLDLCAYLIEIARLGPERASELKPHPSLYLPPPTAPVTASEHPQVFRTMLPEAGPASLAIGLGRNLWTVFDPQRGGLTYVWRGELDLAPVHQQKINLPAIIDGELFYRESLDRPVRPMDPEATPKFRFLGYRFLKDAVELKYRLAGLVVRDRFSALPDGSGVERRLQFSGEPQAVFLVMEPQPLARLEFDSGYLDGDHWCFDTGTSSVLTMQIRQKQVVDGENKP